MQNEGAKQIQTQASKMGFCGNYIWYAMSAVANQKHSLTTGQFLPVQT